MERKLVTIRKVSNLQPIPNADLIEVATIDGWQCVVKKGEFNVGDKGLYFEIDSFLPGSDERFKFLEKGFSNLNNKVGARVRTIKLKGQISQGLLLPLSMFPEVIGKAFLPDRDYSELLGVIKYENPELTLSIPKQQKLTKLGKILRKLKYGYLKRFIGRLEGKYPHLFRQRGSGLFPTFIPKTDEERVQNLIGKEGFGKGEYIVSVKLDGSSMTVYQNKRKFGVCSRNIDLSEDDSDKFWAVAKRYNLDKNLKKLKCNLAVQGELCGPGIQGNREGLKELDWFIFNIWDIDGKRYLEEEEIQAVIFDLHALGCPVKIVPSLALVKLTGDEDMKWFLDFSEGKSLNAQTREGVVFSEYRGQRSFKVISNSYLLKHKE